MTINFNVDPYYDDYNENKKFHKILFRPGYAVQARELTQLQTILQQQIARQGNSLFKEGAMVVPGQISFDTKMNYIKLTPKYLGIDTKSYLLSLLGKIVIGSVSGVSAQIVQVTKGTSTDADMLFVKYVDSGPNGTQKSFIAEELLTTKEINPLDEQVVQIQVTLNTPFGESSAASIERGIYYVKGNFVLVESQTIILSKFSKIPTAKVGLKIVESLVTPDIDETLLDNAQNSYNYAAPGAHRYAIDSILESRAVDSIDTSDFIQLLQVKAGKIQYLVNTTAYSVLEQTLARRTYDESGNYTIKPFLIDIREYRNNNRGTWVANTAYLQGDIVSYNKLLYVAPNNAMSSNVANVTLDTNIIWTVSSAPFYNRGINPPLTSIIEPVLDAHGQNTYNVDGTPIMNSPRSANVADNLKWEAQLDVGMQPGKAYVYGYEIEKIGATSVTVQKSRETISRSEILITTDMGNYILVTNMNYIPDISIFSEVTIYNRYTTTVGTIPSAAVAVGTARIRGIEWDSGTSTGAGANYKVFLFDIKMNVDPAASGNLYSFNYKAKQLYISGATTAKTFTADIVVLPELKTGAINVSTTSVVGSGTKFLTEFKVGDYLYFNSNAWLISSILNDAALTLDVSIGGTPVVGIAVFKSTALLVNPQVTPVIFPLPDYAIKTVTDSTYYTPQLFTSISASADSGGLSTVIVSVSGGVQLANPNAFGNFILISQTDGTVVTPSLAVRNGTNTNVTFTVPGATYGSTLFNILGTVEKDITLGLRSKTKTTGTATFTFASTAQAKNLWLSKPDGYALKSVLMKSGTFAIPGATYNIDITSRFTFDGGQTDSYYGISSVSLKNGQAQPTAPIQVTFEYFNHGGGDFFTADSYPDYKNIPTFSYFDLRDSIDFRPRSIDSSSGVVSFSSNVLSPKYGSDFIISYENYLARNSTISINSGGQFIVSNSASSLNPAAPQVLANAMPLYNLSLEPYTFSTAASSVISVPIVNKRYTMNDIGRLESRINNLEYYTSLSLLEQSTQSLVIKDDLGLDMFKNGFIVDNFTGHNVGDTSSLDYLCSVDMDKGVLRPFFSMDSVDFIDTYSNNTDRLSGGRNYQLTGNLITLPYTNVNIIKQPYASDPMLINPFAVFTYIGAMIITPPNDNWFEINRKPDIIIDVMGNYNTIKTLATKAGVLGTVWNAWQTQWTGTTVTTQTYSGSLAAQAQRLGATGQAFSINPGVGFNTAVWGWHFYAGSYSLTTTNATPVGQTRTGITTSLQETINYQTIDDKTLNVVTIPFIRSRNVLIQNRGLKATTVYHPFFDKQDVSAYCTQASVLIITNKVGNFDTTTNAGNDGKVLARSVGDNPDFSLNVGDVITGTTSGTTAIVVGIQISITNVISLYVVNVKSSKVGTITKFLTSEGITSSISGTTAIVSSFTAKSTGAALTSDSQGELDLVFNIPNTDNMHFRTGTKEFALLDIAKYDTVAATTYSQGEYAAQGFVNTMQKTVNAIKNATLVTSNANDSRTIIDTSTRVVSNNGWYDPLAQTFLIDGYPEAPTTDDVPASSGGGGCFLTSVDIFFAIKDPTLPVILDIRNVVNGYPGRTILPFSQVVMYPKDIIASTISATVATTFVFPSPVYVQNATEYCIVLTSNSLLSKVWTSKLGGVDIDTKVPIDKQPYTGVLFQSQNASTWTASQDIDLKFNINRAKFTTGVFGTVEFENSIPTQVPLDLDPFHFTSGSPKIRVNLNNHGNTVQLVSGTPTGSIVNIQTKGELGIGTITCTTSSTSVTGVGTGFTTDLQVGSQIFRDDNVLIGEIASITNNTTLVLTAVSIMTYTGGFNLANPVYGIYPANLFKMHRVSDVQEYDSFIITVAQNATQSGAGGGNFVTSSRNIQYDSIQPMIRNQVFANTQLIPYFKTTSGKSLNGTQTPFVADTTWQPVALGENNHLKNTNMIASIENTFSRPQGGTLNLASRVGLANSAMLRADLYSSIDTLSPVIDTSNVNAIMISNKINVPSYSLNVDPIDTRTIITADATVTFDGTNVITIADTGPNRAAAKTLYSGQYITISGSSVTGNNSTLLITDIQLDGSAITVSSNLVAGTGSITLVSHDRYFAENAPTLSSSYSKYVTKQIKLANPSTFLKITMAANIPSVANVLVYYKLSPVGSNESFNSVEYVQAPYVFNTNETGMFIDSEIDIPNLPSFDSVTIKLVMVSTNSCLVPQIKELRIIACA